MAIDVTAADEVGTAERFPAQRRRVPRPSSWVLILALAAITLMIIDVRGGPTTQLRELLRPVLGAAQSGANAVVAAVDPQQFRRPDTAALEERIAELERRNAALAVEADRARELAARAADPPVATDAEAVTADVVAAGESRTMITIAAGAGDAVTVDSAVLADGGLVGRVVAVTADTATVMLLSDPASAVGVRLRESRETAVLRGTGDPNALAVELFDPLVAVAAGEPVITVGSPGSRPFPAGLTVGSVAAVTGPVAQPDRTITVAPAVDLTRLDSVAVLLGAGDGARAVAR